MFAQGGWNGMTVGSGYDAATGVVSTARKGSYTAADLFVPSAFAGLDTKARAAGASDADIRAALAAWVPPAGVEVASDTSTCPITTACGQSTGSTRPNSNVTDNSGSGDSGNDNS